MNARPDPFIATASAPAPASAQASLADPASPIALAIDVMRTEAEAITAFTRNPPASLGAAIDMVAGSRLPVVCCGVGKSGLVAAKIAATMASLGTPAFALSGADAAHGDLGAVIPGSVVMLLSNSGATAELMRIVPTLQAMDCRLIALVGNAASPLARAAHIVLPLPIAREADHIGMAPTASTTLQMAAGDAIAVAASRLRDFTRADFLRCHPAGQLGQHAQPISAIMRTGAALPTVLPHTALAETVSAMSAGHMGAVCVIDWEQRLLGLIVDGDVRRIIQRRGDLYALTAGSVMRADPLVLPANATLADARETMRAHGVILLPVTDDAGQLLGMVHSVDLVQSA